MRQILFLAFLGALGYLCVQLLLPRRHATQAWQNRAPTVGAEEMVRDSLCHVYLPRSHAIRRKIQGQEHFFCSPGCLDKFRASLR
jgi:YHS domain-containing protein